MPSIETSDAFLGSGTVPFTGPINPPTSGAFPQARYPTDLPQDGSIRARRGRNIVVINPEDFSAWIGLDAQAVAVATSAVPLPAVPLPSRRALAIHNNGPGTLFIGRDNVTASIGFPLASGDKIALDIQGNDNVVVYGISDSTADVRVLEVS